MRRYKRNPNPFLLGVRPLRNVLRRRRHEYLFYISIAVVVFLASYNISAANRLINKDDGDAFSFLASQRTKEQFKAADDPLQNLATNWHKTTGNKNLDIGVPVKGQDGNLVDFVTVLGTSIQDFRRRSGHNETDFRLIVTRYPSDDSSETFRRELAHKTSLKVDKIIFATTTEKDFHRAFAINLLHKKSRNSVNSVLAIVDVDINVGPRFLFNSLTRVSRKTVYFPIVWSQFRPSNVRLVEKFIGPLPHYSDHRGIWRDFGYGMYSISGLDAQELLMDESFVGWGGEDNDFYGRAKSKTMTVIREKEYDLVHIWHPKYCRKRSFVKREWFDDCIGSRDVMEGSKFGQYLLFLKRTEPVFFETFLNASSHGHSGLGDVVSMAMKEYKSGQEPQIEISSNRIESEKGKVEKKRVRTRPKQRILIGVTASRKTFGSRVAEVVSTWGEEKSLPNDITVRYFVGDSEKPNSYQSGSDEDISNLAKQAGITDLSSIVVMDGVVDNEYPLEGKAVAVIKHMRMIDESDKKDDGTPEFDWFMDVDDDTYVNLKGLQKFVVLKDSNAVHYLGQRGSGKPEDQEMLRQAGLLKPYCMGGPGFLMSRPLLRILARNIDSCLQQASQTNATLLDDVIIGICVHRETGLGCWDKSNFRIDTFAQNYLGHEHFIDDSQLKLSVTLHPFKEPGMMTRQHERFMKISG